MQEALVEIIKAATCIIFYKFHLHTVTKQVTHGTTGRMHWGGECLNMLHFGVRPGLDWGLEEKTYSLRGKGRKIGVEKHVNPDIAVIQSQNTAISFWNFPSETVVLQSLKNKTIQGLHNKDEV